MAIPSQSTPLALGKRGRMTDPWYTHFQSLSGPPSGSATIDFADGRSVAQVDVTGQTSITPSALPIANFAAIATEDNTQDMHIVAASLASVVCGDVVAGTGFTIYAVAPQGALRGTYKVWWRY